ncbi:MAG: hypothetical protein JWP89_329 [Schlesneria sp.]|nr:hypothetical protein [Schlesneria sp.]
MHTFFHGRRRKAGIATLVVALASSGMWLRSANMCDDVYIRGSHGYHSLDSLGGSLKWEQWSDSPDDSGWYDDDDPYIQSVGRRFESSRA